MIELSFKKINGGVMGKYIGYIRISTDKQNSISLHILGDQLKPRANLTGTVQVYNLETHCWFQSWTFQDTSGEMCISNQCR